ncbi:D-alanyl-D-alanine carboxypeptidase [Mesorhizobium sp. M1403]|uniref:D-alanyl-D-alanine carboxypeptidase n=1 Tax=Mesorhizobium sp. M1403 TaxID=2957097 RepID=UPI003335A99F
MRIAPSEIRHHHRAVRAAAAASAAAALRFRPTRSQAREKGLPNARDPFDPSDDPRRVSHAWLICGAGARADTLRPVAGDPPEHVSAVIGEIQSKAAYAHTSWGMRVVDLDTGAVLVDQAGDRALTPGSIMKVYSTATVLDLYGAEYRFHTPVHRTGSVSDSMLGGDLILVASGDFSFGLREQSDGTLGYNNMPEIDHNYADTGFAGGALVKGSDPLAAFDGLAKEVRGAGITQIKGDVIIDARLFETYRDAGPYADHRRGCTGAALA